MINELSMASQTLAASVCKSMVGRLTAAISKKDDVSVQLEALDILGDLLSRFGGLMVQYHPTLVEALQPQLKSPRLAVRKRWDSVTQKQSKLDYNSTFSEQFSLWDTWYSRVTLCSMTS